MQKQILFIFFTFIYSILHIFAQESNLHFKGSTIYLGSIQKEKLPVTLSFSYTNNSKIAIKIIDIKASNDCKITNWNKQKLIQPGISGFITLVYENKNIGVFNEKISVKTNESNVNEITLSFGGAIVPRNKTRADFYTVTNGALSFKKNNLNYGDIKNTEKKTDTLYISNTSMKTITLETAALNPPFVTMLFPAAEIKPSAIGKIVITYNAALRNAYGKTTDTVFIQTDDEVNPLKDIYLSADIYEDFSKIKPEKLKLAPDAYLVNTTYDFRYAKKGSEVKAVFNIKNKGKTQLVIRKTDLSCDCIKVIFADKIRFDRDSPIEVILNTTHLKGMVHETVTLITNDPKKARIVLHIDGLVD